MIFDSFSKIGDWCVQNINPEPRAFLLPVLQNLNYIKPGIRKTELVERYEYHKQFRRKVYLKKSNNRRQ
jgi:hypothetical protein